MTMGMTSVLTCVLTSVLTCALVESFRLNSCFNQTTVSPVSSAGLSDRSTIYSDFIQVAYAFRSFAVFRLSLKSVLLRCLRQCIMHVGWKAVHFGTRENIHLIDLLLLFMRILCQPKLEQERKHLVLARVSVCSFKSRVSIFRYFLHSCSAPSTLPSFSPLTFPILLISTRLFSIN